MEQQQSANILVVDDESVTRISLSEALRLEGYQVATAASGEEALSLVKKREAFDLIILDLKMPGMDGLEVTEAISTSSPGTVVILLTAFGTMETAIQAIRKGAHDYLLKPCPIPDIMESVREGLEKRQQEMQRRLLVEQLKETVSKLDAVEEPAAVGEPSCNDDGRFLEVGDIVLDRQKHVARLNEHPLDLTPTEFKILSCLMETPDQVWSPQDLVRRSRGYETDTQGARAIIRVHIRRLRQKVEPDPSQPRYILNVRGVGYMFSNPSDVD
jgi:DNA-binding response OmpR family regulator